jgi:tetratricopeptide (TPR) repeat protein
MTARTPGIDLHPEELLEREADGALSPAEQARLDAHVRQCPACRMERRARADFSAVDTGPEPDVHSLVADLLHQRPVFAPPRRRRRVRPWPAMLVAAALLALSGLAAAAAALGMHANHAENETPGEAPIVPVGDAPQAARPHPHVAKPAPAPESAPTLAPAPESALAPTLAPAPALARPSAPPARPIAASLFTAANAARRRAEPAAATALYRQLIARFPGSDEGRTSLAVLGRMRLDDGSPIEALACFDAYLRRGGPLTAEAMLGRATALGRLGRADDERDAWAALLEAFPSSLYGERARAQLATRLTTQRR